MATPPTPPRNIYDDAEPESRGVWWDPLADDEDSRGPVERALNGTAWWMVAGVFAGMLVVILLL